MAYLFSYLPSINPTSAGKLTLPEPITEIPPQSPARLAFTGLLDVNTIGRSAVPSAINLAPLVITKLEKIFVLHLISVPGSIVSVALFATYTIPDIKYTLSLLNTVLVVIILGTIAS